MSLRLKILPLALSAILVGNALAYWQHHFTFSIFILSLITASLLQILSNLANDYGDVTKDSDSQGRVGPLRAIQLGLLTLSQLRKALWISALLATFFGLWLLLLAYDNLYQLLGFVLLGTLAIVAAITYTVGKKPYGYIGLGDLSVLIFFGLVAVIGSYYLQTKSAPLFLIMPAISSGLLSVAVLNINNLRDADSDKLCNKRTLIVIIGKTMGRYYHLTLLILSLSLFGCFAYHYLHSVWVWLLAFVLPFFAWHIIAVLKFKTAQEAIPLLLQMVKLALLTNLLYCLIIILS